MKTSIVGIGSRIARPSVRVPLLRNRFSITAVERQVDVKPQGQAAAIASISPRWMPELQSRIKLCISQDATSKNSDLLRERLKFLDENWLELSAGREGFLGAPEERGLDKHAVQWGEMDALVRHVNNIIYNRYAESGRIGWTRILAKYTDPKHSEDWLNIMVPDGLGIILGSIKTDYKFPMTFPDHVTVLHKLTTRPDYDSDRFFLEAVIYSQKHRRPAARCFEDIVVYDYAVGKKTALKPFMVDDLRATYDLQVKRKQETEDKVAELYDFLEHVEKKA